MRFWRIIINNHRDTESTGGTQNKNTYIKTSAFYLVHTPGPSSKKGSATRACPVASAKDSPLIRGGALFVCWRGCVLDRLKYFASFHAHTPNPSC